MTPSPSPADLSDLAAMAEPGSESLRVVEGAELTDALDIFSRIPDLRLVPVVDKSGYPVGAVFEKDLRLLLFNPYGHALMRNPSSGLHLGSFIRPCPAIDVNSPIGEAIEPMPGLARKKACCLPETASIAASS